MNPVLDVVAVKEMSYPALVVLGFVNVRRKGVRQVRGGVDERIAKGYGETNEDQNRHGHHDEHGRSPAREFPTLEHGHEWIQEQRYESADQHQENDVFESKEDLPGDEDHGDHEDRGEDGLERDVVLLGAKKEP
jgi:hypothetical protein